MCASGPRSGSHRRVGAPRWGHRVAWESPGGGEAWGWGGVVPGCGGSWGTRAGRLAIVGAQRHQPGGAGVTGWRGTGETLRSGLGSAPPPLQPCPQPALPSMCPFIPSSGPAPPSGTPSQPPSPEDAFPSSPPSPRGPASPAVGDPASLGPGSWCLLAPSSLSVICLLTARPQASSQTCPCQQVA